MAIARRTNRYINTKTSIKWNKQRKHTCKSKTRIKKHQPEHQETTRQSSSRRTKT